MRGLTKVKSRSRTTLVQKSTPKVVSTHKSRATFETIKQPMNWIIHTKWSLKRSKVVWAIHRFQGTTAKRKLWYPSWSECLQNTPCDILVIVIFKWAGFKKGRASNQPKTVAGRDNRNGHCEICFKLPARVQSTQSKWTMSHPNTCHSNQFLWN